MKTTTFRSLAITQLKDLRTSGIELQVKLNASNDALHQELLRIEAELASQELEITDTLDTMSVINYQSKSISTVAKTAHFTALTVHISKQLITLVYLTVILAHEWDLKFTAHPTTRLIEKRIRQFGTLVWDITKWQLNAQLGTTCDPVRQLFV